MSDETYCYPPDFTVLRNKLNIRDAESLDRAERLIVQNRSQQGVPSGDFDLPHLKAIHRHLFGAVYDWAGKVRTVEISKGDSQFQPKSFIEAGMKDIHGRIVAAGYFKGTDRDIFAQRGGEIIGDLNHVHPFREGNGRTQRLFLKQLADRAGHRFDIRKLDRDMWMEASARANDCDYTLMQESIRGALTGDRSRSGKRIARARDTGRDR
ncbi:Fic/DOC family protein [Shimia sediminis]|uniref:Fic/DOC family protein n=1 Tax=Shimia sediminis TaxID=2497945 RepID=UPI000F8E3F52|nr:Fic family protein [Shimia sediminis]